MECDNVLGQAAINGIPQPGWLKHLFFTVPEA